MNLNETKESITELLTDEITAKRDHVKRLWTLFYCVDSVKKLLDRSERLKKCECEAECYQDIEGPKAILTDTVGKFEQLLFEIDEDGGSLSALAYLQQIAQGGAR